MEEKTETLGRYRLFQQEGQFKLGLDAMLLSRFVSLKRGQKVCELGCGAGAIIFLLLSRQPDITIDGVEIQREAAELARRSVEKNGLGGRVRIFNGDFRADTAEMAGGSFDLAVSNPPYLRADAGKHAQNAALLRARMEIDCTLEDVCSRASFYLRAGGLFGAVYPPERLAELFCAMRRHGLEPKRLCMAHHSMQKPACLVLIEGRKGGRPGLKAEPPVILEG